MKTTLIALFVGLIAFAFNVVKETEYNVVKQQSEITWIGRKVVGEHSGTVGITNGQLIWKEDKLTGGSFEIDMASINNTDIENPDDNKQLVGHLKSEDFFSTEKHPTAKFVITDVKSQSGNKAQIKGNLTIKGITNPIEFPATVQVSGNQLKANAKILVDRTQYDIRYGSGSFFDNLGDKAIDNDFELNVALVATK